MNVIDSESFFRRAFSHGPLCSAAVELLRSDTNLFTIQAHFQTDNIIRAYPIMRKACTDTELAYVHAFDFSVTFQKVTPLRRASGEVVNHRTATEASLNL